ncbi:PLC-like phosphodiesterase [Elsinoe ampelina]|uniref:PLC-like phosphodiesterase n=1 Tax=Elsinoe ampelina TaxID=302913 RepID=A0A6A6GCQ0_9PEZI|nr:PLC-like phosphodiesterase [Elsinoe ampelina]
MQYSYLWLSLGLAFGVSAQQSGAATDTRAFTTLTGSLASEVTSIGTSYASNGEQVTFTLTSNLVNQDSTSRSSGSSSSGTGSITTTSPGSTSTVTLLLGGGAGIQTLSIINGTSTIYPNATATGTSSTSSAAQPTNTQPCNGWPEFCNRGYGNITQVTSHNAFFNIRGNAASNQAYSVTQQLDDGIRMLSGGVHYVNNTLFSCHTSCDLLNAGTLESGYSEVAAWVRTHPYDVVTLLIVNSDFRPVEDFVAPIQNSGLGPYLYEPPYFPMRLNQWPTLSEMILRQQRVVIFMDYNANQTSVPYVLDEFRHIWETPFSPQNAEFPCDLERPPQLQNLTEAREEFMYMANHNLNTAVSFAGTSFLIPNTASINVTNAAGNETGMLGAMDDTCERQWGRSPNWLLVDYYDRVNGSVFEVAARANNVTYDRECCGYPPTSGGEKARVGWSLLAAGLVALGMCLA